MNSCGKQFSVYNTPWDGQLDYRYFRSNLHICLFIYNFESTSPSHNHQLPTEVMNVFTLQDFLKPGESHERRCDTVESLEMRNCKTENVINPKPNILTLKDNDLNSDLRNVVQLKPQRINVTLRVGEEELIFIM